MTLLVPYKYNFQLRNAAANQWSCVFRKWNDSARRKTSLGEKKISTDSHSLWWTRMGIWHLFFSKEKSVSQAGSNYCVSQSVAQTLWGVCVCVILSELELCHHLKKKSHQACRSKRESCPNLSGSIKDYHHWLKIKIIYRKSVRNLLLALT